MNDDTKFPATRIVYWPGKKTYACVEHANSLVKLGKLLGTVVETAEAGPGHECANCQNEAEKTNGQK